MRFFCFSTRSGHLGKIILPSYYQFCFQGKSMGGHASTPLLTFLERDAESDLPSIPLTHEITTETTSHFSPGSEKSTLPKPWLARQFASSVEMPSRCHEPQHPDGPTCRFRHSLISRVRERGKELTGRKTHVELRRWDAKEQRVYFQCVSSCPAYVCATPKKKKKKAFELATGFFGLKVNVARHSESAFGTRCKLARSFPSGCRWDWCIQYLLTHKEDGIPNGSLPARKPPMDHRHLYYSLYHLQWDGENTLISSV